MLRLLLFVEPKPLPEHLFRNLYWLEFPLRMLRQLHADAADQFEFHVAVPRRFLNRVRGNPIFKKTVYSINETAIAQRIHAHGLSLRDVWNSEFLGTTDPQLKQSIDRVVCNSLPDLEWDIVLTFGEECRYSFADRSMKLNVETSPFSRDPFQHSFFMDHCGLFRNAAPSRFFGPAATERPDHVIKECQLTSDIKTLAMSVIQNGENLQFRRRFDQYLLVPLQASNYSSFDAQCKYNSQIDYLLDVVNQVDLASGNRKTGILVTEHPNVNSIDQSNQFRMVLSGLHDMFPNLEYLPRAKFFSAASFALLSQADWVWTVASNVGPVASFLGKTVGSPVESHIAYAAQENTVEDTLNNPGDANAIKPVFHWMFENYIIPSQKIEEPDWLATYLHQRYSAFGDHKMTIKSFVPTQCELHQFIDGASGSPTKSIHYRSLIEGKIVLYSVQTRNRLENVRAKKGKRTFVLINDTAELESHRHIGCNHVLQAIHENMDRIGYRMLRRVNGPDDVPDEDIVPDWVIINGEGSFHHDSLRTRQLLDIALSYKGRGAKVALINSIWESNSPELASLLEAFDVVAVRDGNSQKELLSAGIEAILTPDFSLGQWHPLDPQSRKHRQGLMFTDSIIYERALKLFDASLRLGGNFCLLDHRWVNQYDQDGCFGVATKSSVSPDVLTNDGQIDRAQLIVTGRFHVAMACVALGNAFVFVESNTNKITNLCKDIGLPVDLLNVTELVDACDWDGLEERIRLVTTSYEQYLPAIRSFRQQGMASIENVFQKIATG